jgi:hypothetical protein
MNEVKKYRFINADKTKLIEKKIWKSLTFFNLRKPLEG